MIRMSSTSMSMTSSEFRSLFFLRNFISSINNLHRPGGKYAGPNSNKAGNKDTAQVISSQSQKSEELAKASALLTDQVLALSSSQSMPNVNLFSIHRWVT